MSDDIDHLRSYADRVFDGVCSKADLRVLESLILSDQKNLQAYVEMINLHGALIFEAEGKADEQAVMAALQNSSPLLLRQEDRQQKRRWWFPSAMLMVCLLLGWGFYLGVSVSEPIGTVVHLTNAAASQSQQLGLGRMVIKGKVVDIQQGVVSLQLGQVLLDLVGPIQVVVEEMDRIRLLEGSLVAHVLPGGEGFVVQTPDTQVVDLGTKFSVEYSLSKGTHVSVQKGRARVNLLNSQGAPTQVLELTSHRSAQSDARSAAITESEYTPGLFRQVSQARGAIFSTSGQIRTIGEHPKSLSSESIQTRNHILMIPELQDLRLDVDLEVATSSGLKRIPAGTVISSYLIHYDPVDTGSFAPRAAATFMGQVLGILTSTEALNATDALCGLPGTTYESRGFRGLEPDADQITLSDDNRTVSCFFGMAPPAYLDQARILIVGEAP